MTRTSKQLNDEILALSYGERSEFLTGLTPDELREFFIYRLCDLGYTLDEIADSLNDSAESDDTPCDDAESPVPVS